MNNNKNLYDNAKLLHEKIPDLAIRLPFVDVDHLEFCKTEEGEDNIKMKIDGREAYLHSNFGAIKEAESWFQSLSLENVNVLYVYGIGLGYYYHAVKKWLQEDRNRFLVFLEDDETFIRRLIETENAKEIITNQQVEIVCFGDEDSWVNKIAANFVGYNVEFSASRHYQQFKQNKFHSLKTKLIGESISLMSIYEECVGRYGMEFFSNFYRNIFSLNNTYRGASIFKSFKNIPIIVCGAGPSLNKNAAILRELRDRALILAGGSAINVLENYGVTPHIAGGVDPTPSECDRFSSHNSFELPLFFVNRLNHNARNFIHGLPLFLPATKGGGYVIQSWFDEIFNMVEEGSWTGYSVLTFCVQLALALGGGPIIFVGADLAATNMQRYAAGVLQDSNMSQESFDFDTKRWDGALWSTDIYGEKICTQWKWIIESQWFSSCAQKNSDITFINATEGGIGFKGVPNMKLQEVADKYCCRRYDLDNILVSNIQKAPRYKVEEQKIIKELKELKQSLERCEKLCDNCGDGFKLMAFNDIGEKYIKPFENMEHVLTEKLENVDKTDLENTFKEIGKIKKDIEESLKVCETLLKQMNSMEDKFESQEDITPREAWERLDKEIGYKYVLSDVANVLNIKIGRTKHVWKSRDDDDVVDKINSSSNQIGADVLRFLTLKDAAKGQIQLLESILKEREGVAAAKKY